MAIAKTDLSRFNVTFARDMILSLNWMETVLWGFEGFLFICEMSIVCKNCLLTHRLRVIGQRLVLK